MVLEMIPGGGGGEGCYSHTLHLWEGSSNTKYTYHQCGQQTLEFVGWMALKK